MRFQLPITVILTVPPLFLMLLCIIFSFLLFRFDNSSGTILIAISWFIAGFAGLGGIIGSYIARHNVLLIDCIKKITENEATDHVSSSIISEFTDLADAINSTSSDIKDYHKLLTRDNFQLRRKSSSIIYAAHDGIVGVNRQQIIKIWNNSAHRIFGYTMEDAIDKNINDLLIPKYLRQQHRELLQRAFERIDNTGRTEITGQIVGKLIDVDTTDKNGKPLSLIITVLFVDDMLVGFIQDVTEHRKLEAEKETYLNNVEKIVSSKIAQIQKLNEMLMCLQHSNMALTQQYANNKAHRQQGEYE